MKIHVVVRDLPDLTVVDYVFDDECEQERRAFARRAKDAWEAGQTVITYREDV